VESEVIVDVFLTSQGVHHGQLSTAGISEDVLNPFLLQNFQESLPAGDQWHIASLRKNHRRALGAPLTPKFGKK
jgi:hypothetical protein